MKNFLSPVGYRFQIHRLPNTVFSVQGVDAPGVSIGEAQLDVPFQMGMALPGGQMVYPDLSITVSINEDLSNYMEIYDWMSRLANTEIGPNWGTFKDLPEGYNSPVSDAQLIILTASNSPNLMFTYFDAFPTGLDGMQFTSMSTDVDYISMGITFAYRYWKVEKFNDPDGVYEQAGLGHYVTPSDLCC